MAYVDSAGHVVQSKPWSFKLIQEYFWGFIGFFVMFFRGMFHMDDPVTKGQYGQRRQVGNPGRRMGGFRGGFSPAAPPCAPGGG